MAQTDNQLSACANLEPFALQVLGNSMEPEFPDKCIVIIEPAQGALDGMYVMALVEGVRWFRQYRRDGDGERLVALNELYPDIPLEGLDWKVEGIIRQRNIRREVKHYKY